MSGRDKTWITSLLALSAVVFAAVAVLGQLPRSETMPAWVKILPRLNAFLNATCTVLLVVSWRAIRIGRRDLHRNLNVITFALSSLFLVSYVVFHAFGVETRFPAEHPLRPLYLAILLSHILLAAVVLPMVLVSFYWALSGQFVRHRALARFTMPVWLYVTATGVVVYLMISPYYGL